MADVEAIYAQAGIEIVNGVLMFEGVPFHYFTPVKARSNILNMRTVRNAIAPSVAKITALGFEIVESVECCTDEIIIDYASQFIGGRTATISISDNGVDVTINSGMILSNNYDEFVARNPKHVRTACIIQELRAIHIAAIFAALPQPIAEEIAAEFSLY